MKSPAGDVADVWLLGVDCSKGLLGKLFEPSGLLGFAKVSCCKAIRASVLRLGPSVERQNLGKARAVVVG